LVNGDILELDYYSTIPLMGALTVFEAYAPQREHETYIIF